MDTKSCIACRQELPLTSFGIDRRQPDEHHKYCRDCNRAKCRAYYQRTREFQIQRVQHWQRHHDEPGYLALKRGRTRTACQLRKEIRDARSSARRYGNDRLVPISIPEWEALRSQPCFYCGGPAKEIDHLVPLIQGGLHVAWNLARACRPCNIKKHDQDVVEFALRQSRLDWLAHVDPRVIESIRGLTIRKLGVLDGLRQAQEVAIPESPPPEGAQLWGGGRSSLPLLHRSR